MGITVAKGSTVVEVDVGIGLQGAVGTVCALANGVDRREGGFGTEGFYLAHADGVDVAEDDIGDALGGDVAVVFLVGIDVVGSPLGVFETSGTFFVAGLHDLDRLVDEGADEVVEVVLIAACVATVVEDDTRQLVARGVGDGTKPVVEDLRAVTCRGSIAKAADDWGEGGHGLPEVGHTTAIGQLEEDVVVGDVGRDGLLAEGEGAELVGEDGIAFGLDTVEECKDGGTLAGVVLDEIVALADLYPTRIDDYQFAGVGRMGMDVLDDDGHVVVRHVAEDAVVKVVEVVESDAVAFGLTLVEGTETGKIITVDSIPVGGVDIPEGIACADALPDEGELLLVSVVGQLMALADIGDIVRLLATGTKQQDNGG